MDVGDLVKSVKEALEDVDKLSSILYEFSKSLAYSSSVVRRKYYSCIEINWDGDYMIIGDLHGDFETLVEIIERERVFSRLEKNELLMVFLGDYIDRGLFQAETITAISILKNTYPENIVTLRGNHEPPPTLVPHPHDFPSHLMDLYGDRWESIYRLFTRVFQKIPLVAIIPDYVLFLHGGPPSRVKDSKCLEEAFTFNIPVVDDDVIEDILWSDPIEYNIYYRESYRGAGKLFGYRLTSKTLKLANVKYIIRAHEPVDGGYKFNHKGRVVTLFTSKAPAYGVESVAYMVFDKDSLESSIEDCFRLI